MGHGTILNFSYFCSKHCDQNMEKNSNDFFFSISLSMTKISVYCMGHGTVIIEPFSELICKLKEIKFQDRFEFLQYIHQTKNDSIFYFALPLNITHLSLATLLWDVGKQNSPRWDAAFCGVTSGAILFA